MGRAVPQIRRGGSSAPGGRAGARGRPVHPVEVVAPRPVPVHVAQRERVVEVRGGVWGQAQIERGNCPITSSSSSTSNFTS